MRKLATTVHVHDPETGRSVVFLKGATPPKRIQDLITNQSVWETSQDTDEADPVEDAAEESTPVQDSSADGEPPRSGKGSSKDAWASFASQHGVGVDDEDSRDDIVAKLIAAGKISE
jgi:hypothetical protein